MKRAVILMAVLAFLLAGCRTVSLTGSDGQIAYRYGEVSFTEELTAEELAKAVEILDGKTCRSVEVYGEPACGFSPDVAITVDGTVYMLAQDDCGIVRIGGSDDYIQLTDGEREELEQIFTAHGGSFQCV